MRGAKQIAEWIRNDPIRWEMLAHVRSLSLPDCWIGAGFVRNFVWSILHGQTPTLTSDVDVIWYDASVESEARDQDLELQLRGLVPGVDWSVTNQARVHIDNGDPPYLSTEDALLFWPETATAVAVRRTFDDKCEILAPMGLSDLLTLKLRPAGAFVERKRAIFDDRVQRKQWLRIFPRLALTA